MKYRVKKYSRIFAMLLFCALTVIYTSLITVDANAAGALLAYYDFDGSVYNKASAGTGVSFVQAGSSASRSFYTNGSGADNTYLRWTGATSPGAGYQMKINKDISTTYTIAIRLSYDQVSGYKKIIDYKNFGQDNGFYFYEGKLCYYVSGANNGISSFSPGQIVDVVVTRDASTNKFTAYTVINGNLATELEYNDTAGNGIAYFDGTNTVFGFFRDDGGGEYTSAGSVYSIKVWDYCLTKDEASSAGNPLRVTYNASGASGVPADNTVYSPGSTVLISSSIPAKTGLTFYKWLGNNGAYYSPGDRFKINSATTLTAVWCGSVSYNANGGTGAPAQQTKIPNTTLKLSGTVPTREHYKFFCWNTSTAGNGTNYYSNGNYITDGVRLTLYARWTPNQYTVSFASNGGSSVAPITQNYNTTISAPADPTRTGYTFDGWYTNAALTSAYDFSSALAGNFTLYAKWRANQYTISYDCAGGTNAAGNPTKHTYNSATTVSAPTRIGYTFTGWQTNGGDEKNLAHTLGATDYTAAISLKATWIANVYAITYDMANGTNAAGNPTKHTYNSATTVSAPTRIGYTFTGWQISGGDEKNIALTLGATDYTAAISLKATWIANVYAVTYDMANGINAAGNPTKHTYDGDTLVSDPTRIGYTFTGWQINGGDEKNLALTLGATDYTAAISLKATWIANVYAVTYDMTNGINAAGNPTKHTYDGATVITAPTRIGYTFTGWQINGDDEKHLALTLGATDYTAAISLKAVWTANVYAVTYDMANGINAAGNPTKHTYDGDTLVSDPTRIGYTFTGWQINDGDEKNLALTLGATDYLAAISLKATWIANVYAITYDMTNGINAAGNPTKHTYDGATVITAPTRIGYTFTGWQINGDDEKHLALTLGATDYTAAISLKATWIANVYAVTYDMANGTNAAGNPTKHTYNSATTVSAPTRIGYTFTGWQINGGDEKQLSLTLGATDYLDEISLTATWTANSYKVIFDGNGATGGTMADIVCTYDVGVTVTGSFVRRHTVHIHYENPLKDNEDITVDCIFKGWNHGNTFIPAGEAFPNLTAVDGENVTLTAVWEPAVFTLPEAAKVSNTLLGWSTLTGGEPMAPGSPISVLADTDIFCVWKKDAILDDVDEDEYVAAVELIKPSEGGGFVIDNQFSVGVTYDTIEEAMKSATECVKKEEADDDVDGFESALDAFGTGIEGFEEKRFELLSSIQDTGSGYTFDGSDKTYETIAEAIKAATLILKTEILTTKEEALKSEVAGYLHECDGETIVVAIQMSSTAIEDLGLDNVDDLEGTYNDALAAVRLTKYKQNVINQMTDEINAKYAEGIYTEQSLSDLFDAFNRIGSNLNLVTDTDSADGLYGEWQSAVKKLKVMALPQQVIDEATGNPIGYITSFNGIYADAVLEINHITPSENEVKKAERAARGMKVYTVYDISLSVLNENGYYIVTVMLPESCELVREFVVVYIDDDGTTQSFVATPDENGYLTFTTTHFSEYYVLGKPPVSLFWMFVPVFVAIGSGIAYLLCKKKEEEKVI